MRDFADIIVSKSEDLGGLEFDPESFSNAASYRISYKIPENERLLVYACGEKFYGELKGRGTIITDEAIYVDTMVRSRIGDERIPLKDITGFLIYESKDHEVRLISAQKECRIFSAPNKKNAGTAAQLVRLLSTIRDSMLISLDARNEYRSTVRRVYSLIKAEFYRMGVLGPDHMDILKALEDISDIRRDAIFLQLENEYRTCNRAAYDRLLAAKAPLLNDDNIKVLSQPDQLFFQNFIMNLGQHEAFFDVKAIINAYLSLKAQPMLSLNEAHLLLYLCVRMEDFDYLDKLIYDIGDDLEVQELWDFFLYYSEFKNHRMHTLMSRMAGMGEISQEELLYTNDLGFCCLHYALILRNKELIRHILPLADWSRYKNPFEKDKICQCLFDPMFVACMTTEDKELLRRVFIHVSPQASALNRSIRGMDSMIDINKRLYEKYPEYIDEYAARIAEYENMRSDMLEELNGLADREVSRQLKLSEIIREAGHPLAKYVMELYSSPGALVGWLSETARDKRISKYKLTFFVTRPGIDIGLSFMEYTEGMVTESGVSDSDRGYLGRESRHLRWEERSVKIYENPTAREAMEEKRRAEAERQRRKEDFLDKVSQPTPYEGSWFSAEAHESIKALKEEYRVLVKMYHPDSSGDDRTAKTLMKIMTERADILDRIRSSAG